MRISLLLTLVIVFFISCAQAEEGDVITSQKERFRVVSLAQHLEHPWSLAFLPDNGFLISERRGRLWHLDKEGIKTKVTGVSYVYHEGQGGLLDLALEPNFKDGGWLYFSYAASDPQDEDKANTEVARARLDITNHELSNLEVIFKAQPKVEGGNHWGSRLLFAPDGTLYITLGERFDYKEEAQNIQNHLGTVVRMNPDGTIPEDNPFARQVNARSEIYSYGNRNVQGIALHPVTGEIWMHEHGPKGGDEINILKAGANYGWPEVTFGVSYWGFEISDKTSAPGMEDPILQWTPSIAPSGMAFYTGDKFPQWEGNLFVGALAHKHLRRLELDGNRVLVQEELLKERGERIRDVRVDREGYIYVLTDEPDGQLLKLEPVQE